MSDAAIHSANRSVRHELAAVVRGALTTPTLSVGCIPFPDPLVDPPAAVVLPGGDGRYETRSGFGSRDLVFTVWLAPGSGDEEVIYDRLDQWIERLPPALAAAGFTYVGADQPTYVALRPDTTVLACAVTVTTTRSS